MFTCVNKFLIGALLLAAIGASCSRSDSAGSPAAGTPTPAKPAAETNTTAAVAQATPSNKFTPADVAKLKWIEGTWRGMDGETPFYERYKIEANAMVVDSLKEDGSLDGEPGRFELKNGEFGQGEGDKRSAASEITDTSIQFVPAVAGKGNSFRFVKQPHGWDAILEWSSKDKGPQSKTYKMEPWSPKK